MDDVYFLHKDDNSDYLKNDLKEIFDQIGDAKHYEIMYKIKNTLCCAYWKRPYIVTNSLVLNNMISRTIQIQVTGGEELSDYFLDTFQLFAIMENKTCCIIEIELHILYQIYRNIVSKSISVEKRDILLYKVKKLIICGIVHMIFSNILFYNEEDIEYFKQPNLFILFILRNDLTSYDEPFYKEQNIINDFLSGLQEIFDITDAFISNKRIKGYEYDEEKINKYNRCKMITMIFINTLSNLNNLFALQI